MQKMRSTRVGLYAAIILTALMISACSTATPQTVEVTRQVPVTVIVETTEEVPVTVVVTQLVEVVVTATPPPPTPTPEVTPTPAFQRWTSTEAADAFAAAGLEAENVRPMTVDDYGMAPMTAVEGSRFLIPSLCADCGGRIFSFASQKDLDAMEAFYVELGKSSALFFSWVFTNDNILVQINGDLPETTAQQYEAALAGME